MEETNKSKEYMMLELRADWPLTKKELKINVRNCHPEYCLKQFDANFQELLDSKEVIEYDPIEGDLEPAYMPNYDLIKE